MTSKLSPIDDLFVAKKLVMLSASANKRGLEFSISFSKLKKVLNTKKCYFTGVLLNRITDDDHQLSIDRVDNNVGYIDSNIVACGSAFNKRKGSLTVEEIKYIYNALKKAKVL